MTTLSHISTELKDVVFAALPARDLAVLCRTSKCLRASAFPLLYRTIVLAWDGKGKDSTALKIPSLLQTLVDKPKYAANVRSLHLATTAAPKVVEGVLQQTSKLNTLNYQCMLPSSQTPLSLGYLRRGLGHTSTTLTHLTFRYDIEPDEAADVENLAIVLHQDLGSLQGLTALTHLNISLFVLFGQIEPNHAPPLAEVLPPKLRHLTINDDLWGYDAFCKWGGDDILAVFQRFFGEGVAWKAATPELQEFVLDMRERGWEHGEDWQPEQMDQIQSMFVTQGVRCSILDWEFPE
ncbi:hypothetical protein EJ04DRAFT_511957 [Polyplosphaeria fusca]|uniref:F-box domain-containing protein n=1 Tax=Polyplosphaeria fusca TaxID=682080 RepID=A0A9P4QWB2_9PLEO|nr:hypothetical protein EJ04DRAFT_511957 [Polyplosphaeria fusca]